MFELGIELFVPDLLQSSERNLFARLALHLRQQCRVADRPMRAIRGKYGRTNVSTDFRRCECAWSASAPLVFERLRCAIPSLMPSANDLVSSLDAVTSSKSGEAVSSIAWNVLKEDGVLHFSAEMRHVAAENEGDEKVTKLFSVGGAR
jgi:hypothetical protein